MPVKYVLILSAGSVAPVLIRQTQDKDKAKTIAETMIELMEIGEKLEIRTEQS